MDWGDLGDLGNLDDLDNVGDLDDLVSNWVVKLFRGSPRSTRVPQIEQSKKVNQVIHVVPGFLYYPGYQCLLRFTSSAYRPLSPYCPSGSSRCTQVHLAPQGHPSHESHAGREEQPVYPFHLNYHSGYLGRLGDPFHLFSESTRLSWSSNPLS